VPCRIGYRTGRLVRNHTERCGAFKREKKIAGEQWLTGALRSGRQCGRMGVRRHAHGGERKCPTRCGETNRRRERQLCPELDWVTAGNTVGLVVSRFACGLSVGTGSEMAFHLTLRLVSCHWSFARTQVQTLHQVERLPPLIVSFHFFGKPTLLWALLFAQRRRSAFSLYRFTLPASGHLHALFSRLTRCFVEKRPPEWHDLSQANLSSPSN
jgi:hypothetical protein